MWAHACRLQFWRVRITVHWHRDVRESDLEKWDLTEADFD